MQVSTFLNASYTRIDGPYSSSVGNATSEKSEGTTTQTAQELTSSQKALISRLQASDTAVKAHERAHISAGGGVILSGAN